MVDMHTKTHVTMRTDAEQELLSRPAAVARTS
jgi:hypothetical protein